MKHRAAQWRPGYICSIRLPPVYRGGRPKRPAIVKTHPLARQAEPEAGGEAGQDPVFIELEVAVGVWRAGVRLPRRAGGRQWHHGPMPRRLTLSLDAVIVAVTAGEPRILTTTRPGDGIPALPSGLLDAEIDATLELGLRRWIAAQTGLTVGYVEQLYTFGDRDRSRDSGDSRHLSVGYLGLVKEA